MARACRFQFYLGPFRAAFLALLLIACASATARAGTKAEHLHLLAAAPAAHKGTISGAVLDELSHPVAYARVYAMGGPKGAAFGTGLPWADTDAKGRFVIRHLPWGTFRVLAGKPNAGYPSMMMITFGSFYGRGRIPEVTLSPQAPAATVVVRIGPKAGILSGVIVSARTGEPITQASIDVRNARGAWVRLAEPPHFALEVPSQMTLALTFSAPGFAPWRWTVKMTPSERKVLLIRLRPLSTKPGTP